MVVSIFLLVQPNKAKNIIQRIGSWKTSLYNQSLLKNWLTSFRLEPNHSPTQLEQCQDSAIADIVEEIEHGFGEAQDAPSAPISRHRVVYVLP